MSGTFNTVIQLIYLAAASCFVLGLHLMNNPATARRGNQVSVAGMVAAIVATGALVIHLGKMTATGWAVVGAGILIGGGAGLYTARNVKMTAMPQLVSVFNAVGGGAAALVAILDVMRSSATIGAAHSVPTVLDVIIGSVTFSGSVIAAGKLQGLITSAPVTFKGARVVNLLLIAVALGAGGYVIAARILTAYYFVFLLIILPLLGLFETAKPLPNSISESVLREGVPVGASAPPPSGAKA